MLVVDSQVHIWEAHSAERPWPDPKARSHGIAPIRDVDLIRNMDVLGISGAVLVPPAWDGGKNDVAIKAVERYPGRFAIMGRLPLNKPVGPDVLDRWKQQPGMKGLRFTLTRDQAVALEDGSADWLWPAAERSNLPLMILPPGLLRKLEKVIARHAGLKVIIDHLALPTHYAHDDGAFEELPDLLRLARYPNVAVKASALPCYSNEPFPFPKIHKYVRQVFDAFGPTRMFWGSDVSRLPASSSYSETLELFTKSFDWLKGDDLAWVMGRGICKWIDWDISEIPQGVRQ